ncbi:hypothetical protein ANAPC1_01357 [Anaplasma phagocytophilum]|uniref:Uncharacterized protein n=1 Tax=Anaplasma phagocytophilum TaxID=948 RepID=A0AA45UU96_ANAPH|nr:hypothetical protein [Anaplasma phagocytophilum]SBO14979.1 hypothetical protein ANAPC1_01357 [Anaplasma phagocytophilum]
MFSGNAMHGNSIVGNYITGYEPICNRLISGLQNRDLSYFAILKALLCILDQAAESVERAQSIVEKVGAGTNINAVHLALSQKRFLSTIEAIGAAIEGATANTHKETIAVNFLKRRGSALIMQCLQALSHLDQSRHAVKPLTESDPNIIRHVSSAVAAMADAIAVVRGAHTLATGNVVVEDRRPIKETKLRIHRCINTAHSAVNTMRLDVLQTSIDRLREGGSGEQIQKMMHDLLKEVAALSELIHDGEGEESRKSVSSAAFVVNDLLLSCAALPVSDCPKTAFCTSAVRAAMFCAYDEHRHNAAGTHQSDDEVGAGNCLSMMLIEAAANACNLDYSMSAVPEATSGI